MHISRFYFVFRWTHVDTRDTEACVRCPSVCLCWCVCSASERSVPGCTPDLISFLYHLHII